MTWISVAALQVAALDTKNAVPISIFERVKSTDTAGRVLFGITPLPADILMQYSPAPIFLTEVIFLKRGRVLPGTDETLANNFGSISAAARICPTLAKLGGKSAADAGLDL